MAFTQDFRTQRRNYNDGETRIGEKDRLWYDSGTNSIRIGDGVTPGGAIVGGSGGGSDYVLPTASSTTKGGVKIGSNITITDGVISVAAPFSGSYTDLTNKPTLFSGSYTDLSNKPTIPSLTGYATESFVNSQGFLTSVGTISYNDLSNKPTLFSGSYDDLTNKPTIPSLTGYATETYVTTRGYLTTYTETDPVFTASDAAGITSTDISNWGTAYGWGDHAAAGYLTTVDQIVKVADTFGITDPFKAEVVADLTYGVTIETWTGLPQFATSNSWEFGYDGTITFPDSTVQTTAWTGSVAYSSITGTPTLATVATSGSYTDLSNKPTIPTTVTVNGTSITLGSSGTITAAAGTLTGTTLNSTVVSSSLTSVGTLTGVTSNAATAFIAGAAAESGVALEMPREGALRNLYNGLNNMYFDVSIGGTTNGQFQFRSSSSFTNVLTMSPTAFNVSTAAVVTARTPSFGRLAWNSAIDTELTIDDYRFRISNQGGIFPQVISNVSGQTKNSAWTVVAARSGSAITQTGSTGTLVPNNSWTTLYNSSGMDSAGDTYVCTLQDKNQGRIYRVTFMRSDNGATTGYNIIAERLI